MTLSSMSMGGSSLALASARSQTRDGSVTRHLEPMCQGSSGARQSTGSQVVQNACTYIKRRPAAGGSCGRLPAVAVLGPRLCRGAHLAAIDARFRDPLTFVQGLHGPHQE